MVPKEVERWCERNGWNVTNAYERLELIYLFVITNLLILALCMVLWQWRGIWSVYISQVENQKFLACHYCPMTTGILVEMKDSSQSLQEVQSLILSKPKELVITGYAGSKKMTKLVSESEVKGRVLFLFEPKIFN